MTNILSFFYAGVGFYFPFLTVLILGIQVYQRSTLKEALLSFLIGFILFIPTMVLVIQVQPAFYLGQLPGTLFQPTLVQRLFGITPLVIYFFATVLSFWYLSYRRFSLDYRITVLGWWKPREKWELKK